MTDPLTALGRVSRAYQAKADEYEAVLLAAATAEAEYKSKRAQAILRALAAEERVSHAKAETIAEADEEIARLYQARLAAQAKADAHRAKLNQLREQVANGRTHAATSREIDRMHADGQGGGA